MKNTKKVAQCGLILSLAIILFSCQKDVPSDRGNAALSSDEVSTTSGITTSTTLPTRPNHIIFVWFENKGYSNIIGSSSAPYMNSLLPKGTLFTNAYALGHPSYPNYIKFFSGAGQGITNDNCISGTPFSTPNLYTVLKAAGKSFAWYSESMPSIGYTGCSYGYYREKHNPVTIFSNVPGSVNRRFSDFNWSDTSASHMASLPQAVCITPNMINDMHDGSIASGDYWLKSKLSKVVEWCRKHNSIFVVYFDESESTSTDLRIPVIAVGQHIMSNYKFGTRVDHYSWTKTISSLFGASTSWTSNLTTRSVITGCWK